MPKTKYFDEEDALQKVMKLFWGKGYTGTSIQDILNKLEIGKQSLYDTFGDKNTLFIKALQQYHDRSLEVLTPLNSPTASLADIEHYFLKDHSAFYFSEDQHKACFVGNTISALNNNDHNLLDFVRSYLELIENSLYNALECAQRKGEIKKDLDTRIAAKYLLNNGYGLGLLARAKYDKNELKEVIKMVLSTLTS